MVRLILVKGNSFVSKIIKRVTDSEYSHCGFLFGNTTVEADYGGVQVRDISTYPWPYDVFEINGMTWDKHYQLNKWCAAQIGKPYDYLKVIGLFAEIMFHYSGVRSLLDSKTAFCCTELISQGLDVIGLSLNKSLSLTPQSLSLDPRFSLLRERSYKP